MRPKVLVFRRATALGGAEKYLLSLIAASSDHIEYLVVTNLPEFADALRSQAVNVVLTDWAAEPFGKLAKVLLYGRWPLDRWRLERIVQDFAAAGGKAVYCQSLSDKFIVTPVAVRYGLRVVWIEHGSIFGIIFGFKPLIGLYRRLSTQLVGIVCVSQAVANNIALAGVVPEKLQVIYNGTPPVKEAARWTGGPVRILTASRLTPDKGHDLLLAALGKLPDGNWQLTIAGDGPERERLMQQASSLGISDQVSFAGYRADLTGFFAESHLFCNPTINPSEGLSLATLEAMAAKLPVIVSGYGGTIETVLAGQSGIIVDPKDTEAFSRALTDLLGNQGRRETMGAAGHKLWQERFSLPIMANKTVALLTG